VVWDHSAASATANLDPCQWRTLVEGAGSIRLHERPPRTARMLAQAFPGHPTGDRRGEDFRTYSAVCCLCASAGSARTCSPRRPGTRRGPATSERRDRSARRGKAPTSAISALRTWDRPHDPRARRYRRRRWDLNWNQVLSPHPGLHALDGEQNPGGNDLPVMCLPCGQAAAVRGCSLLMGANGGTIDHLDVKSVKEGQR